MANRSRPVSGLRIPSSRKCNSAIDPTSARRCRSRRGLGVGAVHDRSRRAPYESAGARRGHVLTCYWQIGGRNELGFPEWIKLDLKYIDTWSLMNDLIILQRTIPSLLGAR
ncbi:MAG: sugar transferase [Myxococcota bacterium]